MGTSGWGALALRCMVCLLLLTLGLSAWAAGPLTVEELRGRRIFRQGLSDSEIEIIARLAGADVELPASSLTCAGCHGHDGRGRPEGGVTPSDLTWRDLTRPYEVTRPGGRRHPPYTGRSLLQAIAMGVDPAGNELGVAMPRYSMSHQDMQALSAYIRRLGDEPQPGISDGEIVLGSLLPLDGPSAAAHRARRQAMQAYVEELNQQGGIYNRQLKIRFVEAGSGAGALGHFLRETEVFALVGGSIAGSEAAVDSLLLDLGVPTVAPFTLNPPKVFPVNPNLFFLYAGFSDLGRAMASFAQKRILSLRPSPSGAVMAMPTSAILHPADPFSMALATELAQFGLDLGWPEPVRINFDVTPEPAILAENLHSSGVEVLFFLGDGAATGRVLASCAAMDWQPLVLAPGALVGRGLVESAGARQGEIHLAYPTLPKDRGPEALSEYERLARKHGLPKGHLGAQLESIAALKILVEGLRRSGRDLSRAKLVAALEELSDFTTGLTPPVTYGPGRRGGARGAYLVPFSLALAAPNGPPKWVEIPH